MPLNHVSRYSELTDYQYMALGKVVVEWANIEFLLGVLLGRLLATPEFLARTYTESMAAVRLQDAITQAIEIHKVRYRCKLIPKDHLIEIAAINSSVVSLRISRNKIAHYCWSRSSDDEMFGTKFAGGVPTSKSERRNCGMLRLSDLSSLHRDACLVVDRLNTVISALPSFEEEQLLALLSESSSEER